MVGRFVGLEHEYEVVRDGVKLDFHHLIHRLGVPGRRLDPGDIHAYRLASGLALTVDRPEAEIASPPIETGEGFTAAVEGWASHGYDTLRSLLPPPIDLAGFSTHLSVSVSALGRVGADALALRWAVTFAPAMALIMEGPASLGLYVRPRPGRLEICGEYLSGARLGAAAVFAVATVRALHSDAARDAPAVLLEVVPAHERYGWRVRRHATGTDLYRYGRDARIGLADGRFVSGQELLEACRELIEPCIDSVGDRLGLDAIIAGDAPLGVETTPSLPQGLAPMPSRHVVGRVIDPVERPGWHLRAVVATWAFTVFEVEGRDGVRYVNVPTSDLSQFLNRVASGVLDGPLLAALASRPDGSVLGSHEQTSRLAVFQSVRNPVALLAPERDPHRAGAGWKSGPQPCANVAPVVIPARPSGPGSRQGQPSGRPGKYGERPGKYGRPGKFAYFLPRWSAEADLERPEPLRPGLVLPGPVLPGPSELLNRVAGFRGKVVVLAGALVALALVAVAAIGRHPDRPAHPARVSTTKEAGSTSSAGDTIRGIDTTPTATSTATSASLVKPVRDPTETVATSTTIGGGESTHMTKAVAPIDLTTPAARTTTTTRSAKDSPGRTSTTAITTTTTRGKHVTSTARSTTTGAALPATTRRKDALTQGRSTTTVFPTTTRRDATTITRPSTTRAATAPPATVGPAAATSLAPNSAPTTETGVITSLPTPTSSPDATTPPQTTTLPGGTITIARTTPSPPETTTAPRPPLTTVETTTSPTNTTMPSTTSTSSTTTSTTVTGTTATSTPTTSTTKSSPTTLAPTTTCRPGPACAIQT